MSKKPETGQDSSVSHEDAPNQSKSNAIAFSFRELTTATKNFRQLIGEGGYGPVYKGTIESTGQIVAVKKLNHASLQGNKEFLVEVLMLSLLRHPNLVNLVGYCDDGDQRILVYEFFPLGSLEYHLHDLTPDMQPLDWDTRMKIAAGIANGLNYLHHQAKPPVIYRDLKSSNVLMDDGFLPRLSDFGLAKFGPHEDKSHVTTRVMGTYGYCAPEYAETGHLTLKSDVYSFGIILLEIVTGLKALDETRVRGSQTIFEWARPRLSDRKTFLLLADPLLEGKFPESKFCKIIELVLICVRENALSRPTMTEVVRAMKYFTQITI